MARDHRLRLTSATLLLIMEYIMMKTCRGYQTMQFSSPLLRQREALQVRMTMTGSHDRPEISYGQNNFGDIMGGCETNVVVGGEFLPMERVVITANGNLQRIMSAYYGAPVSVKVINCDKLSRMRYHREVELMVDNQPFCRAIGEIELLGSDCFEAIENKNVGVGQLFRYMGILPSFQLRSAGRKSDGVLWREYDLTSSHLCCTFMETFTPDFLKIVVPRGASGPII